MDELINKIRHYRRTYSIVARAHYLSSNRLGNLNAFLGIPALLISIAICSTIFISSSQVFPQGLLAIAGTASLIVTMLTGLQVFLRTSERSMEHRAAGARFADVRRRLELMELKYKNSPTDKARECITELEHLLVELRDLGSLCPKLPERCYKHAEKEYKGENETKKCDQPQLSSTLEKIEVN